MTTTCPLCSGPGSLLKQEERGAECYRSFRCSSCRSIWCPDHHAAVSPDYVGRTQDDITDEVLWLQGGHKKSVFDQLFRMLQRRGDRVDSVLDIGCGTGGFLEYARTHGAAELYGFDAAEAQVQVAARVSPNVRHCLSAPEYVGSLGYVPKWDLITLWDVIEHLRDPRALLADVRQFCEPGTLLFLCTPNGQCEFIKLHLRRFFSVPHSFIPWEHVLYYSPDGLRAMLEQCGFEVLCLTGAKCYQRRAGGFELIRRAAFSVTRTTPLVPQLFVLARKAANA